MTHRPSPFKPTVSKLLLIAISSLSCAFLFSLPSKAWIKEGRWSTAYYNCRGLNIKLSVDMTTRIGGSEVAPIREAYLKVNDKAFPAVWIVGGDSNSAETNNREWTLTFWKNITLRGNQSGSKYVCKSKS